MYLVQISCYQVTMGLHGGDAFAVRVDVFVDKLVTKYYMHRGVWEGIISMRYRVITIQNKNTTPVKGRGANQYTVVEHEVL